MLKTLFILSFLATGCLVGCAAKDWPPSYNDMETAVKDATDHGTDVAVQHFTSLSQQVGALADTPEQRQTIETLRDVTSQGIVAAIQQYEEKRSAQAPSNAGLIDNMNLLLASVVGGGGLGTVLSRLASKSKGNIEKSEAKSSGRMDQIEAVFREKMAVVEMMAKKAESLATATAINDKKTKVAHSV